LKLVLVTGASGFVGRALVAHLAARGHAVVAASRSPGSPAAQVEWRRLPDLREATDWAPLIEGVDVVVHAAAAAHTHGVGEAHYDAVNWQATLALGRALRGKVERLIFLSSIRAQSGPSAIGPLTEGLPPRPTDAYGRSKLAAELGLAELGTRLVVLRPVLVAGSGAYGNLATMLRYAKLHAPLPFAALTARRSLIARADLCSAVEHVLDAPSHLGQTYIIAHPEPIAIADMFAALREGLGRKPALLSVPNAALRLALRFAGRSDAQERLFGDLVASPAKLMATEWSPRMFPHAALVSLAQAALVMRHTAA
jgi:nucleoside-diphosphate-sugar epimerase